jgi:hypothetical protein
MTTFNLKQARVDSVWGAVPDRDQLVSQIMPQPTIVVATASATTLTPYQSLLDLQDTSDSTEI